MDAHLEIEYRPIDSVIPYARNARTHSDRQIRQLARSIEAFGFINPVLVDEEGVLVAGHARVLAARKLGFEVIPIIRIDHLNDAEKRAYILADNRLAENAGWDDDLLRVELEFLSQVDIDFDASLTGFTTTDIDLILGHDAVPAEVEDLPPEPAADHVVSRPGDLWQLGAHRLMVADCRDTDAVDRLMGDHRAQMICSDPPWNVPVSGHVSGLGRTQHREFPMASGEMSTAEFTEFLTDTLTQFHRISVDGSLHFIFIDWRGQPALLAAGNAVYERQLNLCVWAKTNAGMGSLYRSQHELVVVFKKGQAPHINNVELGRNGRYRSNLWTYPGVNGFGPDRDEALRAHPTVKPVRMLADALLDVTRPGDIVADFFLGSGSTLLAAEQTGRICRGIELDPGYVDVTVRRWENATGECAMLSGTDLAFHEVAAQRGAPQEVPV
jgi:hypothetical protein